MDIETKEAVLKLAGYETWQVKSGRGHDVWIVAVDPMIRESVLAVSPYPQYVINLAYNTFLTRQNDVVETS